MNVGLRIKTQEISEGEKKIKYEPWAQVNAICF